MKTHPDGLVAPPNLDESTLTELACRAVAIAREAGADQAEAYLTVERDLTLASRSQRIEKTEQAVVAGLGLKVFRRLHKAYVIGSGWDEHAIREMARRALEYASETTAEAANRLPDEATGTYHLELSEPELAGRSMEDKLALLQRMESAAHEARQAIENTREASYWDRSFTKVHANSLGLLSLEQKTHCGLSVSVVARAGSEKQVGGQYQTERVFGRLDPERVGQEAAAIAARKLGARPVPSCRAPVVFDNRVGLQFLGYLIAAVNGERVALGETFLAGKLGEPVASPYVTIVDEAERQGGYANSLVDGEGVRTANRRILEGGILTTYLHDLYSSLRMRAALTGSVQRGSYEREGSIGAHNLYLAPGTSTRDQIVAGVQAGLLVTDLMGMGLTMASGNYSIGASGLWIEHGQITHPVERVTIASNLLEMLRGIEEVGEDLRFWAGTGSPTFKIREVAISGE
ncbi:MAG: TldD/PmbA family protein [Candidatus Riflebacteria bacterium]|nr:TldD/PmbA family protein [Candidatus Riflebacteria bacterium]